MTKIMIIIMLIFLLASHEPSNTGQHGDGDAHDDDGSGAHDGDGGGYKAICFDHIFHPSHQPSSGAWRTSEPQGGKREEMEKYKRFNFLPAKTFWSQFLQERTHAKVARRQYQSF